MFRLDCSVISEFYDTNSFKMQAVYSVLLVINTISEQEI